jgi:hypothetical protein
MLFVTVFINLRVVSWNVILRRWFNEKTENMDDRDPRFFACLSAVLVALFNPEFARVVVDAVKNAPTMTPTTTLVNTPAQLVLSSTTDTPVPTYSIDSTATVAPIKPSCPWIPYINGSSNDEDCLSDLLLYGISGEEKEITFFLNRGREPGIYNVCTRITGQNEVKIRVEVKEDLVSARFLVSVGPEPVPNKSAYGFRIQPEIQSKSNKKLYVNLVENTPSGYEAEKGTIEAIPEWKDLDEWKFNFSFRFTGSKVKAMMNNVPFPEGQVNSADRYVYVAYQAMPSAEKAVHFDVEVELP